MNNSNGVNQMSITKNHAKLAIIESAKALATHYNTTVESVWEAIQAGNVKLLNELQAIAVNGMELASK
jgi:hypothetical protein